MARTAQPSWVKHILKLLGQAKAKDPDLARFGAYSHQYKLAVPAGEEAIQKFEEQQGIRLPEEYRDFLMLVGNGGAGPYYGLYGLKALKEDLSDSHGVRLYRVMKEPVIYPKMSEEEWDRMADPEGRRKGEEVHPYAGILPISIQGCTLMTGLMLAGPYRGQVVYYDEDFCGPPFFAREKGFLEWYERWLREVIAGYNEEEVGFGLNMDGTPFQLMELYQQTDNPEEKTEIIESFYKFETLPGKQKTYFKQACAEETDMEVRKNLNRNDRISLFHCIQELKGKEEVLDYFLDYLSTEEDPTLLIYAVWCTEGVEDRQLQELYVKLLDKYRTHENAKFDYKGSQMVLRGGACLGASRPEGQLTSNLMRQFDYFGLDYRGGWKLLMDEGRWREWKQQSGFA